MIKHFIILLIILNWNSYSCECPPIKEPTYLKEALKDYDIIFYGELVKYDTIKNTFDFKIIELFKGNYNKKYIAGISKNNSCSMLPREKGHWLIFSKLKENKINIDGCNPSYCYGNNRGNEPFHLLHHTNWVNKLHLSKTESLENEINLLQEKLIAIKKWNIDLEQLRLYKKEHHSSTTNRHSILKEHWIVLLLISNIILMLLVLVQYFKHKK